MNKMFSRIIGAVLGITMAIGVDFALANNDKQAKPVVAAGAGDWVQITSYDSLNTTDRYLIASGSTSNGKDYYFNGTVNKGHLQSTAFSDSAPASNAAAGVFQLEAVNAGNHIYKIKLVSTSKYVTATAASSGSGKTNADSDSDGWRFLLDGNNFNAIYQCNYSSKYAALRCYEFTSWRTYSNGSISSISTSSGTNFRMYKYEEPKILDSIAIETAPTKTTYYAGDNFDPTGLVIRRNYTDSSSDTLPYADNESDFTFSPALNAALTTENTFVSITYGGKSALQVITVNPARTQTSIELHGTIAKDEYFVGESWDLAGLDLQINWSAGDPTYVDLEDDSVVYECTPAIATSVSVNSFDIEILYATFDETFTIDGLTVTKRPPVDTLTSTIIPNVAVGNTTSSWGTASAVSDSTGAVYKCRFMGVSSASFIGRLNDSTNGYIYTSAVPSGVRLKSVSIANMTSSKTVGVYAQEDAYEGAVSDKTKALGTITSTNLTYEFDDDTYYKAICLRGHSSATEIGTVTITYEYASDAIKNVDTRALLAYSRYTDNGDGTFSYENLGIRFGGFISETLWAGINEETTVQGYGVLLSTPEYLGGAELKTKYATADGTNVKIFTNDNTIHEPAQKDAPTAKEGNRVWNLYKKINFANVTKNYVAVAFIETDGEVVFLKQITANMKDLANDLIDNNPNYNNESFGGSLSYLANA